MSKLARLLTVKLALLLLFAAADSQTSRAEAVERGSATAKAGFKNEDEIAAKFNNWRTDAEAAVWLAFMGYKSADITEVSAGKPHGEKADIVVRVRTAAGEKSLGISIKLVSTSTGFNQIDKRWLRQYADKWKMPAEVQAALRLFTGEVKPNRPSRDPRRMFLNELSAEQQKQVVDFFSANKAEIVSDLLGGDGEFKAGWMMVALKSTAKPRWVLRSIGYTIDFFSQGPVEITRAGNLKIGRITMQRKGGDGGRETANQLQFKMNPALLMSAK
ncbi:MAG: type II restriction endonuclease [Pyrinomonadaceae bacterium]